jgi:hypothetical protein
VGKIHTSFNLFYHLLVGEAIMLYLYPLGYGNGVNTGKAEKREGEMMTMK